MDTALVVAGLAVQLGAFGFLVYLWRTGRLRFHGFRPRGNALEGLPAKETRRLGRLAISGWVVPSDDVERVRAYIDWYRRTMAGLPYRFLLAAAAVLSAGNLLTTAGRDALSPLRALVDCSAVVLFAGVNHFNRRIASKMEATERANGWRAGEEGPPT
jgi:hypothetical protein